MIHELLYLSKDLWSLYFVSVFSENKRKHEPAKQQNVEKETKLRNDFFYIPEYANKNNIDSKVIHCSKTGKPCESRDVP